MNQIKSRQYTEVQTLGDSEHDMVVGVRQAGISVLKPGDEIGF